MKTSLILFFSITFLIARCSEDNHDLRQDIVYINFEDAKAGYNHPFPLDIDNDGNNEFVFRATLIADAIGDHLRFAIISRYNNEVIGENGNVEVLPFGEPIDPGCVFDYDTEVLVVKTTTDGGSSWWGRWKGMQNKYVGIRFALAGTSYYGWVKISVNEPNEQLVVHDMAYSRNGISAGTIN